MLFQHTMDKVLSGEKTLTSRLVKPGDYALASSYRIPDVVDEVCNINHNRRFCVGSTYAVQPGRGKPAVARIRVLAIKRYDVRDITEGTAQREGFGSPLDFLQTWVNMHDQRIAFSYGYPEPNTFDLWMHRKWQVVTEAQLWNVLETRPAERYQAWQLRFELVK